LRPAMAGNLLAPCKALEGDDMNINGFLQDNLVELGKSCPECAGWLASKRPDVNVLYDRIFINAMGLLDWRMENGKGLFEALPPKAIYQSWKSEGQLEGGATIIVGAGLGYGINHVLTSTPNSHKVIVVEPRPEMLLACLGQTDYAPFMKLGKLAFLPPGKDILDARIKELDVSFLFSKINLRPDMSCKQLGPEYDRISIFARNKLESLSVELSTLRLKQETMVGNELSNYRRAIEGGGLLTLEGQAKGLTVAVLGAGPSLSRSAPFLRENRGSALYISALQTLPALERLDLKPDLCFAIDFNESMGDCVKRLKDPNWAADIPLIYSTKMNPSVPENYPGPVIPFWTVGGLATFLLTKRDLVLDAGGNVAVSIERFMTWCGASRFVLAGQDFAWSGEQSHADGHHFASSKFIFNPARDVALKDLDGKTIYSNMGYLSAKRDLEQDIQKSGLPFFNLYGGGAVITGAENVRAEEAFGKGLLDSENGIKETFLNTLLASRKPAPAPVFQARARDWASSLRNAQKRMEKLFKKLEKNHGDIRKTLGDVSVFLKQDPLYMPYLYNEIMDISGLIFTRRKYELRDLVEFKKIMKRVLDKVREMDARLAPPSKNPVMAA